jgi:hypothetical protein
MLFSFVTVVLSGDVFLDVPVRVIIINVVVCASLNLTEYLVGSIAVVIVVDPRCPWKWLSRTT